VAAGAQEGTIKLHVDPDWVMASQLPVLWAAEEKEFPMTTLDKIAQREEWGEIALLKIDVEGMEVEILKGAEAVLRRTHQVIVETHSKSLHDQTVRMISGQDFVVDSEHWKEQTGLLFASRPWA
jgi:hypothetical protein